MRPSSCSPTGISSRSPVRFDGVALGDALPLAEQHGADVVGLEVEREPGDPVGKLEHLERHAVLEAVYARDAVGHRQHGADLGQLGAAGVEALDAALEDGGDLVGVDLHVLCSYAAPWATCLRSCSSRLRIEASRIELPTLTTMPPRISGSTCAARLTLRPGALADRPAEVLGRRGVELDRAGYLDGQQPVLLLPQPLELLADAEDHRHAVLLDQQLEEVDEQGVGSGEQRAERLPLLLRGEVGREEEDRRARGSASSASANWPSCSCSSSMRAGVARDLEQRASVYAGELLHQFCELPEEMPEKSSSPSACSTSRRWSSSSSVLRVTFSVARIVRSATSLRMSWSARRGRDLDVALGALGSSSRAARWPRSLASRSWRSAVWRARVHDLVRLLARLGEPLAVFGEDLVGFLACALGGVDRLFDRLLAACRAPR